MAARSLSRKRTERTMAEQNRTLVYPVVPIRDLVIFPGVVSPLFISRPKSIRAVEEAAERDRTLFIVAEKRPYGDTLQPDGLYKVGTVCKMLQNVRLPDGTLKVVVEGGERAEVKKMASNDSFMLASVSILASERPAVSTELRALMRAVLREFENNVRLDPKLPEEIARSVRDIDDPAVLCDIIASHGNFDIADKQKILETAGVEDRLDLLMKMLVNENELLGFERDLEEKVRSEIDRDQHNYYLREQLKVINDELGEESPTSEADEMREAAAASGMPDDILQKVNKEIGRFCKLPPLSPEAAVARNYIETLTELPWNVSTEDDLDISNARKVLDEDHYGLEDVKERILEFLAVKKRAGEDMRAQVICFVGPPGVGKTSLGKSIARAMGRKFVNISLGGMHDEAEIRGHRRTYVGALPGRIIHKIKQCGTNNPLILMDEIDKLSSDYRGDPASALLEVLDPEQNKSFTDNFLEVPFDLSRVMFITTANSTSTIPRPLLDRMEVISLPGYVMEEKLKIAKKHLIPRILREHGLSAEEFSVTDAAIKEIISSYTMEAGVRGLDRQLAKAARKVTASLAGEGEEIKGQITKEKLHVLLGAPKLYATRIPKGDAVGTAIGLAWTEAGGDVILIESAVMDGAGKVAYTGNLGDIMQESAVTALAYLRSNAERCGLANFDWNKKDIQIHVPAGAVPKDGPSAGITLALSLCSSLTGRSINTEYAMTGEMTLHGNVLPIGGVREKILAAKRLGIRNVILPDDNKPDAAELSPWVLKGMKLHYVSNVSKVFELALRPGE
ncbi:endopeptidase La [Cloacibacillus sp. An23]|nr:endopeptidase La [Cloacibacillus sp. An23]